MTKTDAARWLREHDNYLILTHRRPDGDATGSAAALCRGLRLLNKQADVFPNAQFTEKFSPLLEGLVGTGEADGKTVISVDLAAESMLPYNGAEFAGKTLLSIDHHGSNEGYAAHCCVEADAASCGEVIFDILLEAGAPITAEIAEAVYVAMATDTGCFRFSSTSPHTLRTAAACMEAGADTEKWNRLLFLTRSPARLQVEAYLTGHTEFYLGGKIALCSLPRDVLANYDLQEDDLDGIAGFPRDIAGVEVGVMIRDVADGAKISMRSFAPWNASDICKILGGGGHSAAAGATVDGSIDDAKKAVLDALRKYGAEV